MFKWQLYMHATALVQNGVKARALALLSQITTGFSFDRVEFGLVEPQLLVGSVQN